MKLQTYEDLVRKNNIYLDNLMFGNGFSSYFGSKFRYNFLYEEASDSFEAEDIEMFSILGTTNFETVLRTLSMSIETNKVFRNEYVEIEASYDRIKHALIETVRKVHPEAYELTHQQTQELKTTVKSFKNKIFTTNYDLLPYWAFNKIHQERTITDGFGYDNQTESIMYDAGPGVKADKNPLRLYYLHGALHYYMEDGEVIKITRKFNPVGITDKSLLSTITDSYDWGYFPLYVSEGTWKQKYNKIKNNKYLNFCYRELLRSKGGLTIFGQSLDNETDKHIIEGIIKSNVTNIAYGIYDLDNQEFIKNGILQSFRESTIDIEFFDSTNFFQSLQDLEWTQFSPLKT